MPRSREFIIFIYIYNVGRGHNLHLMGPSDAKKYTNSIFFRFVLNLAFLGSFITSEYENDNEN